MAKINLGRVKGDPFRFEDFTPEQLELLKGRPGNDGKPGDDGPPGPTVPISDSVTSQDSGVAASSKAVRTAYVTASAAQTTANSARTTANDALSKAQAALAKEVPQATEDTLGIVRPDSVTLGVNDQGVMWAATANTEKVGMVRPDNKTITITNGVLTAQTAIRGEISLLPFRPSDLAGAAQGWYFCNGDLYPLTSAVGAALNALSANFKHDWGITVSGSNISVPNMFHSDGRGYFLRAANGHSRGVGPKGAESDAIRDITGHFTGFEGGMGGAAGQAFYVGGGGSARHSTGEKQGSSWYYFAASRVVPVSNENRPLNIGMTPAIYLGV